MTGIWTCPRCRAANGSMRATCALCGAARDEAASTAPPPPPASRPARAPAPRSREAEAPPPAPAEPRAAAAGRAAPARADVALCPVCSTPLAPRAGGGEPSLHCARCGGDWLDEDEIGRLLRSGPAVAPPERLSPRRLWSSMPPRRSEPRPCPRCRTPLVQHASAPSGPVWMDECPHHHGIWFDRDELDVFAGFVRDGGLAHHVAAHHAAAAPSPVEAWEDRAHPEPTATGFHFWWYLA